MRNEREVFDVKMHPITWWGIITVNHHVSFDGRHFLLVFKILYLSVVSVQMTEYSS